MRSLIFFTLFTEKENTPARITFSILVCRIFSMILACMNIVRLKFTHEKSHARTCERAVGVSFRAWLLSNRHTSILRLKNETHHFFPLRWRGYEKAPADGDWKKKAREKQLSTLGRRLGKGVKGSRSPRTPLRSGQDGVTRVQLWSKYFFVDLYLNVAFFYSILTCDQVVLRRLRFLVNKTCTYQTHIEYFSRKIASTILLKEHYHGNKAISLLVSQFVLIIDFGSGDNNSTHI